MNGRLDHTTGKHCGSTSLRNLSSRYGWGYSEPECFGVGAGLGFTYLRGDESPRRQLDGRTPWLELTFLDHLGVAYSDTRGEGRADAWAGLTRLLDDGTPVVVFVDIYHLPYFDSDVHFSPHVVLAVGYDDDAVHLADSEFDDVQHVARADFDAAWSSDVGFFGPLSRRYLAVTDPTVSADVADAYRAGLRAAAEGMCDPGDHYPAFDGSDREAVHGLDGVRAFADDLPEWAGLPDATWCLRFAYQNVEKRGTGGGAFRGLFAPFVARAAEAGVVPDGFATRADSLAADWSTLGQAVKRAGLAEDDAVRADALADASERAHAVADDEERFYEELLDAL